MPPPIVAQSATDAFVLSFLAAPAVAQPLPELGHAALAADPTVAAARA